MISFQNFCGFCLPNYSTRGTYMYMKWMLLCIEKVPGQRSIGQKSFAPDQLPFPRPKALNVESPTLCLMKNMFIELQSITILKGSGGMKVKCYIKSGHAAGHILRIFI